MNMENNWRFKTLETLEKNIWPEPEYDSHVVRASHQLRKKPLNDFEIEDLRIMIGQNIGLMYLIPLALEVLNKDILAEGDFYEGDLLQAVLNSDIDFWKSNPEQLGKLTEIIQRNKSMLKDMEPKMFNASEELNKIKIRM